MAQIPEENESNYTEFRDCLSSIIIERLSQPSSTSKPKLRRRTKPTASKPSSSEGPSTPRDNANKSDGEDDPEELADFIAYIATETFTSLPPDLQTLTYHTWTDTNGNPNHAIQSRYPLPLTGESIPTLLPSLDPSITDSLSTYTLNTTTAPTTTLTPDDLLARLLTAYITQATTPPPPPSSTRSQTTACELCERDWIPLTYHHLIPRMVHAKVVKRGWHRADELQNVAWLCGACHRFVHRFAGHEDLARKYYTVGLLRGEKEVVAFAQWVGRLRWKGR